MRIQMMIYSDITKKEIVRIHKTTKSGKRTGMRDKVINLTSSNIMIIAVSIHKCQLH